MNFYDINYSENKLILYSESNPNTPKDLILWLKQKINKNNKISIDREIGVSAKKINNTNFVMETFSTSLEILNLTDSDGLILTNIETDSYEENNIYNITFPSNFKIIIMNDNISADQKDNYSD